MKQPILLLLSLFLNFTMQAQNRPQPKAGPAPTINIKKPQTFELANGLKVLVVENHKLPRASFSLTLDTPPYSEGNKKGVASLMGRLLGKGSQSIPKDVFIEEVDFLGADINMEFLTLTVRSYATSTVKAIRKMVDKPASQQNINPTSI